MTIAKSINKTLDISVEDVRIDLTATIRSYDLTDTQFIFEIKSSNGMTVNLTGSTAIYIVEYVHNSQTYAIQGDIDIIGTDTLSFNLPEGLKGYSGTVLIGIYVKLTDGTKIDIKDIAVRIEPSIMDKDIDFTAKTYFKDFETVKAEVVLEGEKAKTQIKQVLPSVQQTGETAKTQINAVVTDVQSTGNKAKTDINAVLPSVQAEISEIKTEIENLPDIPDLFVAYADDLNGSGFSKTDNSKLYKGYGVKNSNLPSDYRWEVNSNNLKILGDNLIANGYGDFKNNTNFSNYIFSGVDAFNNKPSFKITTAPADDAINDNLIPIDINKSYEFSMNLKSLNGTPIYLGWAEYDIDGKKIDYQNVTRSSTSTTTLARDLNNGDTVVYLTSASGWIDSTYDYNNGLIFWNYQDSTGYVYPEGVYSRNVWFDLYSRSDIDRTNNLINLKKPWDKGNFKVGTKVSQSKAGNSYKYRNYENTSAPTEWTNTTFRIGEDRQLQSGYVFDYERFSPATKYIKFNAIWLHVNGGGDTYFINNVKLKCIDDKLNSNPVNSVLTTLSQENPSTTLGGTWTQLGTETKFDNTIYYWKRTN